MECQHWMRSPGRRQRISEALARVDVQRDKLASQLGELEATERVLARYSKGTQVKKTASARRPTTAKKVAAPARRHEPTTTAKAAGRKRSSSNLGDQILALATGKTQQEIAAACARALAPTMSAPRLPGTSGRVSSKSAMGNSTPYRQPGRTNRPRSDDRRPQESLTTCVASSSMMVGGSSVMWGPFSNLFPLTGCLKRPVPLSPPPRFASRRRPPRRGRRARSEREIHPAPIPSSLGLRSAG